MLVDIAVLTVALGLGVLGFFRGIFSQAWGLFALVGAFVGAEPALARFPLTSLVGPESDGPFGIFMMRMLAGLFIYIGLLIVGRLIEFVIIERLSLLKAGNRVLGGLLGLIKGAIIAVIALWIGQFAASYLAEDTPALTQALDESVALETLGGYNPLNLLYLNRISPYLKGSSGEGKPLPPGLRTAEVEALMGDPLFAAALASGEMGEILATPAYRAAMADPAVVQSLARLGPSGQVRAPASGDGGGR